MKTKVDNIWSYIGKADVLCVTTNGVIQPNGRCVMGAGIARQARDMFVDIDFFLGQHIKHHGNTPGIIYTTNGTNIYSFPTKHGKVMYDPAMYFMSKPKKPYGPGQLVPGYLIKSDIVLIEQSAKLLNEQVDQNGYKTIVITKPGCALGGLDWFEVKPVLQRYFDDRYTIIDRWF